MATTFRQKQQDGVNPYFLTERELHKSECGRTFVLRVKPGGEQWRLTVKLNKRATRCIALYALTYGQTEKGASFSSDDVPLLLRCPVKTALIQCNFQLSFLGLTVMTIPVLYITILAAIKYACIESGASTPYKRWSKCTMKKIGGKVFAGT